MTPKLSHVGLIAALAASSACGVGQGERHAAGPEHGKPRLVLAPTAAAEDAPVNRPSDAIFARPVEGCPAGMLSLSRICLACDPANAMQSCIERCERGDGPACVVVSAFSFGPKGPGTPEERAQQITLEERGCAFDSVDGCMRVAWRKERGDGVPKDELGALEIFGLLCSRRHGPACRAQALRWAAHRSVVGQQQAMASLREACSFGDRVACRMAEDPALFEDASAAQLKAARKEMLCRPYDPADGECTERPPGSD